MQVLKIAIKWLGLAVAALTALTLWGFGAMIWKSGVNVSIHLVIISIFTLLCVFLFPFVWKMFSKKNHNLIISGILGTFLASLISHSLVMNEFIKTPDGVEWGARKKELEKIESDKKLEKIRKVEAENRLNDIKENSHNIKADLKNCINWRGQVPSLVSRIRNDLHNPRSFEHVNTVFNENLAKPVFIMTYRAENGYGAIRTSQVKAFISYDDCSVLALEHQQ
ncbi:hypothetical protein [Brevundimonas sp. GN22]